MRTIKLTIAFDGTNYHGWQRQREQPTIQGEIERHLQTIHKRAIHLHGAGRTDAGVHALGMVAHFQTEKSLTCKAFQNGLNSLLSEDIRILETLEVANSFHARFSVKTKTYCYRFFTGPILLPQHRHYCVPIRGPLDFTAMEDCLSLLEGTHDFASFEAAGSRDPSFPSRKGSIRTITSAKLDHMNNNFHTISLTGDGFLRHMVRNIAGTLFEVGTCRRSRENFLQSLQAKKRSATGSTAPARGLTLMEITY